MKKIIIAVDSFKGTLSSARAAEIIENAVNDLNPGIDIRRVALADGGEGSIEALGAKRVYQTVSNPFFEPMESCYGIMGKTAVIEIAACAGLPLAGDRKNPELTTSCGAGELMSAALDNGCRRFILALGGSCTNDAGCGMSAALGVKFYTSDGGEFIPTGKTLSQIADIDISGLDVRVRDCDITAMCDIKNPLFGENGAAYIYAPQKGADREMVLRLDAGLRRFSEAVKDKLNIDVADVPGAGAAGGIGAGALAFLGGKLRRGIDIALDTAGFNNLLEGADLVITGEGRFDLQSLDGKAVSGVAARCAKAGVPCVALCGSVGEDIQNEKYPSLFEKHGITAVFSIQTEPLEYNEAVKNTERNLYYMAGNIARLFVVRGK